MTRADCQVPRLSYIAAHADAKRRMDHGERQVFCETCRRWKWQDELCDKSITTLTNNPLHGTIVPRR